MNRIFWLGVGIAAGAFGYHYFRDQAAAPEFESLGEQGRRLMDRGREFAESSRQLAQTGRQLAEEASLLAQSAATVAQSRGREVLDNVRGQAERIQSGDAAQAAKEAMGRFREDVHEDNSEAGAG